MQGGGREERESGRLGMACSEHLGGLREGGEKEGSSGGGRGGGREGGVEGEGG